MRKNLKAPRIGATVGRAGPTNDRSCALLERLTSQIAIIMKCPQRMLRDCQSKRDMCITTESLTAISRRRRPRGRYPKTQDGATPKRQKRIPEYLEVDEVNAIIRAAPSPKAKLLMLQQWRAGLRVSEALDLEVRDLSLDTATPTLRVRSGKGGKTRLVPVHPELHGALSSALAYGDITQGRIIEAHTTTAWRWVKTAVKRAEELGAIAPGKRIGTHTLRHSYARHLLMNGIPINYLSRWLGHSSIQTTLIYLELVPDPTGSLAAVP